MSDSIFKTIPEQIEEQIRQDILSGILKSGQSVKETELSNRFGVSRGPVREVLSKLTQQGLLISKTNKGVRVASQPSESMRPLLVELRKKIEIFALESIFEKITEDNINLWEKHLGEIKEACENHSSAELAVCDLNFHKAIIQSHDDKDLFTLWQPIVLRMLIHYERLGDLMESYQEHKLILDFVKSGDKVAALKALEDNIL